MMSSLDMVYIGVPEPDVAFRRYEEAVIDYGRLSEEASKAWAVYSQATEKVVAEARAWANSFKHKICAG